MRHAASLLMLCWLGRYAWAAPTGLNTIPTADLVPLHQYTVTVQNNNASLRDDPTMFHYPQLLPQLQFGLTPRLEGGVDAVIASSSNDYIPQFNLKWKLLMEDYERPAVGVGFIEPWKESAPTYYLVASRTLNYQKLQYQKFRAHHRNIKLRGRRIHAGVMCTPAGTFPMLGADLEQSDKFVFYSDWISGPANAVSAGGVFVINQDNSLTASLLYGNHEQRFNGLLVNYSRTLKW